MLWSAPLKPETLRNFDMYKHCNHFAGTWQLGRKDLMYRNIAAQIREFGEEYNIVPKTWILPHDLRSFQEERKESEGKHRLWILKPAASSCGRGIRLLARNSALPKRGQYVISTYLMRPHLFNQIKYDLRIYVFVTSYDPLTIFIYQDGLVRFATQKYSTKNRKSRFAHLTNFSVNKKATNFITPDSITDD
jgi:tubulin polyglutamylase TTLL4